MGRYVTTCVVVEELLTDGGHWCTVCLLPSGWRQWLAVRWETRMHLQQQIWCDDCGRRDTVVLDEA